MFKRFFFLAGVNILVMVTVSIILSILGVGGASGTGAYGLNYMNLMIICLVWGMVGSLTSLFISKFMAKMLMGVKIVSPTGQYAQIVQTVHSLAKRAGLTSMPEVGIYESPDINAFATGPTRNNSLVAVSTGLLRSMNRDEVDGVLGHEVSHIANGDMVTMTLLQGVLNAFVMFFARIAASIVVSATRRDDDESPSGGFLYMMIVIVFQIVFGILASILANFFSRQREYRADKGSADLVGRDKMIAALMALQRNFPSLQKGNEAFSSLQISSKGSMTNLLSTHPSLQDRIEALKRGN